MVIKLIDGQKIRLQLRPPALILLLILGFLANPLIGGLVGPLVTLIAIAAYAVISWQGANPVQRAVSSLTALNYQQQ